MDESIPETQPEGALTPPPRVPPTALATATPQPPQGWAPLPTSKLDWTALLNRALDKLDTIADQLAGAIGLR